MRLNSAASSLNRGRLSASIIQPGGEDRATVCHKYTMKFNFSDSCLNVCQCGFIVFTFSHNKYNKQILSIYTCILLYIVIGFGICLILIS